MGIWNKLLFTAVTTLVAAGVMYYLKKREEDEAYDIDEFDEDFEPEGNVMQSKISRKPVRIRSFSAASRRRWILTATARPML